MEFRENGTEICFNDLNIVQISVFLKNLNYDRVILRERYKDLFQWLEHC